MSNGQFALLIAVLLFQAGIPLPKVILAADVVAKGGGIAEVIAVLQ